MDALNALVRRVVVEDGGVTSIEYGLMGVLIAVAIALTVTALGSTLKALFESVAKCFPFGAC